MRFAWTVPLLLAGAAACSSGGQARLLANGGTQSCKLFGDYAAVTRFSSCSDAATEGRRIVKPVLPQANSDGLGSMLTALCASLQSDGSSPSYYDSASQLDAAKALSVEVCPGNVANFTPSTG
jgi:hypothetical protein